MKKLFLALPAAFIALAFSACTSMFPVSDAGNFPAGSENYKVLGRVEVETYAAKSGYSNLYAEAKEKYPECDDVVNVKVDEKTTTLLFIFRIRKYNMSGIAIGYTK